MNLIKLESFDGKNLTVNVWDGVENAVGAIVITHGMSEHAARYDDFAKFLNGQGYIVLAGNNRGHKYNADGEEAGEKKGLVDGDSFLQTVNDIKTIVDYAKSQYKAEVFLLGHSYGSFLSQKYLELFSDTVRGCVLSGTAYMKSALIAMGYAIASTQKAIIGGHKIGRLIDKMSFGAYNKPFAAQGQKFAWLSRDREQVAKYEADEYCGYPLSLDFYTSFFKNILNMYEEGAENIRKDIPIFIAVGSDDPVSNKSTAAVKLYNFYLQKGIKGAEIKVYDKARHEILNEINNVEVYEDIAAFINKCFEN